MQVYAELRILTARPTTAQEAMAPHALYGVLAASEPCSAAKWLGLAEPVIRQAWAQGKLPIITGGTGLYIKALMEGLSDIPAAPEEARAQATALWQEQGAVALKERDAGMAAQLKDGDRQRHIRALEIWLATGKSLSYWQAQPRVKLFPDAAYHVEIIDLPREELYARCDARFAQMLDEGAMEEARAFHALHLSPRLPAMNAVGVPELLGVIDGRWTLEEATVKAQQATRNYAKRQLTWFRNQLS